MLRRFGKAAHSAFFDNCHKTVSLWAAIPDNFAIFAAIRPPRPRQLGATSADAASGSRGPRRQADLHRNCCNCSLRSSQPGKRRAGSGTLRNSRRQIRRERTVHILVFASQKGGTGKTTLSGHLAVAAQNAGIGPVALIDTDPQGSLSHWWNARAASEPLFVKVGPFELGKAL